MQSLERSHVGDLRLVVNNDTKKFMLLLIIDEYATCES